MTIIFVQNRGFGDALWTEPVITYLLNQGKTISLFINYPSVYDNHPSPNLILNPFDTLFPLKSTPIYFQIFGHEKHKHFLEYYSEAAGVPEMPLRYPILHLNEEEKKRKIEKRYAIFHIDPYKDEENYRNVYGVDWKEVAHYVESIGLQPVQISLHTKNLFTEWIPTLNFRQVISLVSHSSLFIGLDSGPSHIAASLRIPSVIVFGSVNPRLRHLDEEKKVFLQSPCPFAHCYHEGKEGKGQPCRLVPSPQAPPCCVQTTDRVLEAISKLSIEL